MPNFQADNKEFELIDKYPSTTQRKYGRPDPSKDLKIYYQHVDMSAHLKRIHNIHKSENNIETKLKKPKKIESVDKTKITHTGIV